MCLELIQRLSSIGSLYTSVRDLVFKGGVDSEVEDEQRLSISERLIVSI